MTDGDLIRSGSHRLHYSDPRPGFDRAIPLWLHRPPAHGPDDRIVLVLHGMRRNASDYRDAWAAHAERLGLLVVAPEFSVAAYPDTYDYNYGNMVAPDGTLLPREAWLFPVLDHMFAFVRDRAGSRRGGYGLFGHSAGAQLVHRLVTFAWSDRIEHAVSANAGSYTLPDFAEAYPFGLDRTAFTDAGLPALFARPMTILLGERDCDPSHPSLPRQPQAMAQGPHRFARGQRYFDVARRRAQALGVPFRWQVATVPDVAHDQRGMAPAAARVLAAAD